MPYPVKVSGVLPHKVQGDDITLVIDGLSDKSLTPLLILNPTIIDTRAEPCGEGTDGDIASHSLLKHSYRLLALRSMLI